MNLAPFLGALFFAFVVESGTEYLFATWLDLLEQKVPALPKALMLKYLALGLGLYLAFTYSLDLPRTYLGLVANPAWVGIACTGYALGRGANFVHDIAKEFLGLQ